MNQELDKIEKWPYPITDYLYKIIWVLVKNTIWKLLWHRITFLRAAVLKIFGANISWKILAFGSTNISRPWDLELGKNVALGPRVNVYNLAKVKIGNNTVVSQDVYICGGTHDYNNSRLPLLRKDIIIGSNVWICSGAFIGPGVIIGDGAVVGARACVFKDVEPWTVVGGNPAKFIKKRTMKNG
jgi:putative colanic acid biosynthesis acetyltransferase WcaF